ncbi:MAG: hypothetical protein Q8Q11_02265 [bacterium]|nr:hypothetical protein [bacterium]MDZ4248152.1 hypothetical protein [Patescibacteria group bacterium]
MARRPKHPAVTLLNIGPLRITLLNGQADWREYLAWQVGLLAAAAPLFTTLLLLQPGAVDDVVALEVLLATLPGVVVASAILWWLIKREYSRSKRFALAFLILSNLTAALAALRTFDAAPSAPWFDVLFAGTALYLAGTGVIGLIILIRGDDVSPWWRR